MTRYEQGFMDKCAELSGGKVDGLKLLYGRANALGINSGVAHVGGLGGMNAGYSSGHGWNTAAIGSPRHGGLSVSLSDSALNNGLLGAGVGAVAGVSRELMRDPAYRKRWLKSVLIGILAGGATGVLGTMAGNLPDYVGKIKGKR